MMKTLAVCTVMVIFITACYGDGSPIPPAVYAPQPKDSASFNAGWRAGLKAGIDQGEYLCQTLAVTIPRPVGTVKKSPEK